MRKNRLVVSAHREAQTRRAFSAPAIVKAGEVPEQRRMPVQKEALIASASPAPATKITSAMITDQRVIARFPAIGADHRA
jgi:hypothetical protein